MRFVTIGDVSQDLRVYVQRFPRRDVEQEILDLKETFSGAATFSAVIASILGVDVAIISKVGNDQAGAEILNLLKKRGVDTSHIIIDKSGKTMKFITIYDSLFHRELLFYRDGLKLNPCDIDRICIEKSDVVCLCPTSRDVSETVVKIGKDTNKIIFFNPSGNFVDIGLEGIKHILGKIDYLFLNEREIRLYAKHENLKESCLIIARYGHFTIIVMMGEKGSMCYDGKNFHRTPSVPVKVIDPTGAGDGFATAFMVKYLESGDLIKAAKFANAVGGCIVTKESIVENPPSFTEIIEFFDLHTKTYGVK